MTGVRITEINLGNLKFRIVCALMRRAVVTKVDVKGFGGFNPKPFTSIGSRTAGIIAYAIGAANLG